MNQVNSHDERILINEEINNHLAKDAIEGVPISELLLLLQLYVVVAKRSGLRQKTSFELETSE